MNRSHFFGHIMALFSIFVWGTTFISTKMLLLTFEPIDILIYRFILGYIFLWLLYPKFVRPTSLKEEWLFFLAGSMGVTFYFLVENTALKYTQASNVGLLISISPILTAFLAHLTTNDEKLKKNHLVGFILAFIGIFLVIFNGNYLLHISPIGDILAILAALAWSIYGLLLKKINHPYHYIVMTRKIFFYGLLTMLPLTPFLHTSFNFKAIFQPDYLFHLLFLGLVASALCFMLWNVAVQKIGVVKSSNYIYLVPLITILTSILLLDERLTLISGLGAILILSGVLISDHGFKPFINRFLPLIKK